MQYFIFIGNLENANLYEDIVQPSLQPCLEEARLLFFKEDFVSLVADTSANSALNQDKELFPTFLPKDLECNVDVYIICSSEDNESCSLLQNIITTQNESFVVKTSTSESASTRLTYLDKARLVIPLLSGSLLQSMELVHELNIAWCRQRDCSSLCFLAVALEHLPKNPTYVSLFPCFFNCEDDAWTSDPDTLKLHSAQELTRVYQSCQCPLSVVLCFMSVVDNVQRWHDGEHCPVIGAHNKLFNCLQLKKCIQRYKENLSKHDNKEVNSVVVLPCTGSNEEVDNMIQKSEEITCAEKDDNPEREHVKQDEVKSYNSVQEVKVTEERNTIVVTTAAVASTILEGEENKYGIQHIDTHGSQDVHQKNEHGSIEQNEDQSQDRDPEERTQILRATDRKEQEEDDNNNNILHDSQDVHQNIHNKSEAIDTIEKQGRSIRDKNKSSACIII